jgi:nitrous-oxide reductase
VTSRADRLDHGAAFVTPNTDYVIETTQYPAPLGGGYAPIQQEFNGEVPRRRDLLEVRSRQGPHRPERRGPIELPPTCRTSPTPASW